MSGTDRQGIIWRPRPDDLENSHIARFMRRQWIPGLDALRERAVTEPDWFYEAIVEDLGISWFRPYERVLDDSGGLPWTEWFIRGRLNIVHNVLDRHLEGPRAEQVAVIAESDEGGTTALSYRELGERVARFAAALSSLGVRTDDAVGIYLPMSADVVVALLACLKIGAVAVPVFAGFGPDALASRLLDAGTRILLTADGTRRRGKAVPLKSAADSAIRSAGCVAHTVVLRHTGESISWRAGRDLWWHDIEAAAPTTWPTAELGAEARSLLLYTSGTTGRPKGVIHTHAGVQVVTAKEVGYHLDVRPGEIMFWLTDIGWMMGPWEILGVLFHGGTVVLLDGAPDYPTPDRLWRMIARHRVTHLGISPTAVRALSPRERAPRRAHDLSSLRVLGSTGEPWDESSYRWLFEAVGASRCPIMNISGGTELMGCLLAPLPVAALKPTSLQGPALGMNVDVLDESGRSVRGAVGYLVCRNAAPNMTRGFLGDPERYFETYFARFGDSIWFHGDWARVDADGHWFLSGRADDTLKIAGKRIGPSEVEASAASHPAVSEAAAVGLPDEIKGTRLVIVAVAAGGGAPTADVSAEVAAHVTTQLGPSMRPSEVRWVRALPVTRSGKILRGVIRRVLAGEDPGDLAAVANPESIDALRRG